MVTGFNHTGIVVDDLDKMVDFYCETLGLKELNRIESTVPATGDHTGIPGARRTLVFVGFEGDHRIELVKFHDPESPPGHQPIPQLGTTMSASTWKTLRRRMQNCRPGASGS